MITYEFKYAESPGAISSRGQKTNIPSRNRETFISPTDNAAKGFCIHIFTQFFICTDVVSSHLAIIGNNIERKMIRISWEMFGMNTADDAERAHHGMFATGEDFDLTFGLMHTIEKAAEILVKVMSMRPSKLQTIMPDDFRKLAKDFNVTLPERFLQ